MGQTITKDSNHSLGTRSSSTANETDIETEPSLLDSRRTQQQARLQVRVQPVLPSPPRKFLPKALLLHPKKYKSSSSSNNTYNHHNSDDGQSRATVSTGQMTPISPHLSSSSGIRNRNQHTSDSDSNRNRNNRNEATVLRRRDQHHHRRHQHHHGLSSSRNGSSIVSNTDKRSNPVKLPRRRQTICGDGELFQARNGVNVAAAAVPPNKNTITKQQTNPPTPQNCSYLERMYDSRTWEMYRRITHHREQAEAFNASNAAARRAEDFDRNNEDGHSATNGTTVSEPALRRVARAETILLHNNNASTPNKQTNKKSAATASTPANGGEEKQQLEHAASRDETNHQHYDQYVDHDDGNGSCLLRPEDDGFNYYSPSEEHSAPPHHHQHTHYCDSGRKCLHHPDQQQQHPRNHHNDNYSEWEHMYGDVEDEEGDAHGVCDPDPTIFLFDF